LGCVAVAVAAVAAFYERYDTRTLKRTIRPRRSAVRGQQGPAASRYLTTRQLDRFDVDFCRAVAAAIFDDPKKTRFVGSTHRALQGLQTARWISLAQLDLEPVSRETSYDLYFPAVLIMTAKGFLVPKGAGEISIPRSSEWQQGLRAGRKPHPLNLRRLFPRQHHQIPGDEVRKLREVSKPMIRACDRLPPDVSELYALALGTSASPANHVNPAGRLQRAARAGFGCVDDSMLLIVKWTLYAMNHAAELRRGPQRTSYEALK